MKTVYIPKGETVHYESLTTEHLVVHGRLHVTYGVKAQSITGSGVIDASSINADTVCIDDVESGTVICKRLIAKRVQAPEVFASESAAVSCFLSAAYVETGKLTAAISEVDEVVAQEVVNLTPKKRTLFGTLFASIKDSERVKLDTVVQCMCDGTTITVEKDRTKNQSSCRSMPLVPQYRDLLLRMKVRQECCRKLCGNCYTESEYIFVNDMGEPYQPNYVTQHFKLVLRKNHLRNIRFHDLRHTCASLLLKNGVPMKDIQEWLGHSSYNTTANIYAHLDTSSKNTSA